MEQTPRAWRHGAQDMASERAIFFQRGAKRLSSKCVVSRFAGEQGQEVDPLPFSSPSCGEERRPNRTSLCPPLVCVQLLHAPFPHHEATPPIQANPAHPDPCPSHASLSTTRGLLHMPTSHHESHPSTPGSPQTMPLPRLYPFVAVALALPAAAFLPPQQPLPNSVMPAPTPRAFSLCRGLWSTRRRFNVHVDEGLVDKTTQKVQGADDVRQLYQVVCSNTARKTRERATGIALADEVDRLRTEVQELEYGTKHWEKEAYEWCAVAKTLQIEALESRIEKLEKSEEWKVEALESRVRMLERDAEEMREELEELWEEEESDSESDEEEGGTSDDEDDHAVFDEDEQDLEAEEEKAEELQAEEEGKAWADLGLELGNEEANEDDERRAKTAEAMATDHWQIGGLEEEDDAGKESRKQESFAACEGVATEEEAGLDRNDLEVTQPEDMVPKWAEAKGAYELEEAAEAAAGAFHEEDEPAILVNLERLAQKLEE